MAGWESLRIDLQLLLQEQPDALIALPSPEVERRSERRFRVALAAWATEVAAMLHDKYGELVELQVGAMNFPDRTPFVKGYRRQLHGVSAASVGLEVEALSPLSIRSGWHRRDQVLVRNLTSNTQVILAGLDLGSRVTNDAGEVVGQYVGPHSLIRREFPIEPHSSRSVPVLIGTASLKPELGYAVPPGRWWLTVSLTTEARGDLLSAPLELRVRA
jgi:hypothetical protein